MEIPTTTTILNYDVSINSFSFRKRQEKVDWKKLASIDIEKLSHNLDFRCLQDNIVHITFCDIEQEVDRNSVDPNYIKLYKLAQLIIEYLLHSQEYLANIIQNLEEKLKQSLDNLEEEKAARSKDQKIVNDLKKECKNRKQQLAAQQQYFLSQNKQYSQCSHCPKTFIDPSFLKSHILRRHPDFAEKISNDDDDDVRSKENINAFIALGKQLADITEKLKNPIGTSIGEDVINKNKNIEDKTDKENNTLLKSIEEWKKDEMRKHSAELEAVRNTLMKELQEMQRKHQKSEVALKELQEKYAEVIQTYLEKTNHHSSDLERKQEIETLKEQFKSQLTFVESDLQKNLKKQEKEWQKKMDKLLYEHNSEIEKLNIALQESIKQIKNEQEKKAFNEKYYEKQIQKLMDVFKKQHYLIQEQEKKLREISLMQNQNQLQIPNKSPSPPSPRTYTVNKSSQSFPKESQVDKQENYSLINYRVKTALKSSPELLNGLRTEFCGFLEDKLQSYGINPFSKRINNKIFHKGIENCKNDQNCLIKKYEKFNDIRNYCENIVNKMATDSINSLNRKSKLMKHLPDQKSYVKKNISSVQSPILKSKNILTSKEQKSVVDSFDSSPKFHHSVISSSPKLYSFPSNSHHSSSKLVSSILTNSIEYSNTFKSPILQHSFDKSKISEEDSSNTESQEGQNSEIFKDRLRTFQEVRPVPIPRKLLTEPKRVSFEDEKSSSEVTESSESYVESSNSSDPEDAELNQYQPIRVKPPSGERVTKLTQSIENQLMGRQVKPPPGAIDVTPTANVVANQLVLEKTSDKSDDDDFSLSYIENELKTFETEIANYKSEKITENLHSDINSAWSASKNDKSEIEEKSSIKKGPSSWDSDQDISVEEIE